jgi:hypothetical protein
MMWVWDDQSIKPNQSAGDEPPANPEEVMKTQLKVLFVTVSAAAILALGALLPTNTVHADENQPTKIPWKQTRQPIKETLQALPTQDPANISNHLKREQLALSNQAVRLEMSDEIAAATQTYIDAQKSQGKDTSSLETALASYKSSIAAAKGFHNQAATILANPAGFDASGNVTDKDQARETVRSAAEQLRQAHTNLTSGALTLRTAVKEYRQANKAK